MINVFGVSRYCVGILGTGARLSTIDGCQAALEPDGWRLFRPGRLRFVILYYMSNRKRNTSVDQEAAKAIA